MWQLVHCVSKTEARRRGNVCAAMKARARQRDKRSKARRRVDARACAGSASRGGLWQAVHPSAARSRCSNANGPTLSHVACRRTSPASSRRATCALRLMRVVARRALEHAFANPMVCALLRFGELLAVAFEADARFAVPAADARPRRGVAQQRASSCARRAAGDSSCRPSRRERVRAAIEARVRVAMAAQAARVALGHGLVAKREHGSPAGLAHVLRDVAVAVAARQRLAASELASPGCRARHEDCARSPGSGRRDRGCIAARRVPPQRHRPRRAPESAPRAGALNNAASATTSTAAS